MDYIDFEIEIGPGRGRTYPVAVLHSPAGEPRSSLRFPFDRLELENRLLQLQNALLRSGATYTRRIASPDEAPVQALGQALFDALFTGDVLTSYDQSQRTAREQSKRLRIKLRIQSPELAALPWEFLYDPREDDYLCLYRRTPIVRYLEPRQPPVALKVQAPLRMLGFIASPADLPELDVGAERRKVEEALGDLRSQGLIDLVWLNGQTWSDLQNAMMQGPWHIFHFIGHGDFDTNRDEGVLAVCDESGKQRLLTASEVGRLLGDHESLRLVVLNACESARGGRFDIFSSTAATLVRRGVPAVVAMQYPISDQAAILFVTRFYTPIAYGLPVDAAMAEARISMSVATRESAEWGTPVLYSNAPDGQLFDILPAAGSPVQTASGQAHRTWRVPIAIAALAAVIVAVVALQARNAYQPAVAEVPTATTVPAVAASTATTIPAPVELPLPTSRAAPTQPPLPTATLVPKPTATPEPKPTPAPVTVTGSWGGGDTTVDSKSFDVPAGDYIFSWSLAVTNGTEFATYCRIFVQSADGADQKIAQIGTMISGENYYGQVPLNLKAGQYRMQFLCNDGEGDYSVTVASPALTAQLSPTLQTTLPHTLPVTVSGSWGGGDSKSEDSKGFYLHAGDYTFSWSLVVKKGLGVATDLRIRLQSADGVVDEPIANLQALVTGQTPDAQASLQNLHAGEYRIHFFGNKGEGDYSVTARRS